MAFPCLLHVLSSYPAWTPESPGYLQLSSFRDGALQPCCLSFISYSPSHPEAFVLWSVASDPLSLPWWDKQQTALSRAGGELCPCLTPLCLLIGTLSGQSAASVLHPQQTLPAPGSVPETGPNQLLQPVKPSPSSDNLYSALTSDGAISVPSLSAPGQGESHEQPPSSRSLEMETQPHSGQKPGAGGWLGGAADLEPAAHTVLWAAKGGG